jgi:galactose-1-phosphate uridylyltransferase
VGEEKNTTGGYQSELRQDIVTGDWVVIATGRAKRPDEFASATPRAQDTDPSDPFAHPEESGQEKDILVYRLPDGDWSLRVFPNKYPAFTRGRAVKDLSDGPYFAMSGVGYHELIVTRDPVKSFALNMANFQKRVLLKGQMMPKWMCINYRRKNRRLWKNSLSERVVLSREKQ